MKKLFEIMGFIGTALFCVGLAVFLTASSFDDSFSSPFSSGGGGGSTRTTLRLMIADDTTLTASQYKDNDVIFVTSSKVPTTAKVYTSGSGPWDCTGRNYLSFEDDVLGVQEIDLTMFVGSINNFDAMELSSAIQMVWMNPDYLTMPDDPGFGQTSLQASTPTQIRAVTPAAGAAQDCNVILGFQTTYQSGGPPAVVTLPTLTSVEDGLRVHLISDSNGEEFKVIHGAVDYGNIDPAITGTSVLFYWDNGNSSYVAK